MMMLDSDSEDDAIEEAEFQEMEEILLLCRAAIDIEGESSGDDTSSEEDHQCISSENSNRHPQVKWTQRLDNICIKVQLAGAKDINVKLGPEGIFTFSATTSADGNSYELTLKLHDKVNVEESKITKGVGNVLCLLAKAKQGWWKKLFNGDEETPHCVEVDWDRWVDEGDNNFENASVLDLSSKSQPSDKSKKERSRKMNLQAEQEFQKRKSQKTSSKPISSAHKGAAAADQLAQAIKAEREGLNCEIKAKNDELEQMRKVAQEQKVQLEEKVALLQVENFNTQRSYKQERFEHLKKFEQEKVELMEKFKQEMAETKTKYEAVANDSFYQVWINNQEGNFTFLGQEVDKVIAGFKQRLAEVTTFSNDAS